MSEKTWSNVDVIEDVALLGVELFLFEVDPAEVEDDQLARWVIVAREAVDAIYERLGELAVEVEEEEEDDLEDEEANEDEDDGELELVEDEDGDFWPYDV